VYDGSQLRVSLDGTLVASESSFVSPGNASTQLVIGGSNSANTFMYSGLIDEVRVPAAVLHTSDFTPQLHLNVVTGTKDLWKSDGKSANDSSGNGNNGSLTGGASYSTDVPELGALCRDQHARDAVE
jgi:hypothetical protein